MVSQAMRPGMLKTLLTDVLPIPYHGTNHCTMLFCLLRQWHLQHFRAGLLCWIQTYKREEIPDKQEEIVVLLGRRVPVLYERHGVQVS